MCPCAHLLQVLVVEDDNAIGEAEIIKALEIKEQLTQHLGITGCEREGCCRPQVGYVAAHAGVVAKEGDEERLAEECTYL